ncbi:MAG: hypothetical protein NT013_28245 [Planctomycetia bacterium]|nr:hypothetical protein [Planctomycetia bacterium]
MPSTQLFHGRYVDTQDHDALLLLYWLCDVLRDQTNRDDWDERAFHVFDESFVCPINGLVSLRLEILIDSPSSLEKMLKLFADVRQRVQNEYGTTFPKEWLNELPLGASFSRDVPTERLLGIIDQIEAMIVAGGTPS